jgi:hypothetical protein
MQISDDSGPSRAVEGAAAEAVAKLRPDAPDMPVERQAGAPEKVRLLSLSDLDGRTNAAKSARALIADLESDLGGADQLSAAERELVRRSALAGAMLQDMEVKWLTGLGIEVAAYTTLANSQSRMLNMLGLRRRLRDAGRLI